MGNRTKKSFLKMKRMLAISSAVFVVLTLAFAGMPSNLASAAGTVSNTGAVGTAPAVSGSIIAFWVWESDIHQDLNADGDTFDTVILFYDASTGQVTNTGVDGVSPAVSGSIIAFYTQELYLGQDLNGNESIFDNIIRYYDISKNQVVNTSLSGIFPSVSDSTIAFSTTDNKISYYDILTGVVINTGVDGIHPAISGSIIAFYIYEGWISQDLNGDGDMFDWVGRYYDTSTGQVTNIGALDPGISISGSMIVFSTGNEIKYYDTSTGQVTNTGAVGAIPAVSGSIITFVTYEGSIAQDLNGDGDTSDNVIRYYDTSTGQVTNTGAVGSYPAVGDSIIAFETTESWIGQDLNGDGDSSDIVIRYFTSSSNMARLGPATLWVGLKNSDDQGTRFDLRAEVYINEALVAAGETLCITGITRNPSFAREVGVPVDQIVDGLYETGDMLSFRLLTRIGTTPDGRKCPGHNNAEGLRLYYDAPGRASRVEAEISPDPMQDFFLDSSRTNYFLNDQPPTGTVKYKDSSSINFKNGNPWKEIGTWSMELQ